MSLTNRLLMASLSILLCAGLSPVLPVQGAEGDAVSYEDAKPFLTAMQKGVESSDAPSVKVERHDDSLSGYTPGDLSSLMDYVKNLAKKAEESDKSTIVDREFQLVGGRLAVCLGTEHEDSATVASTTFCQDLENNLLSRLLVKDADGNVLGRYELY